MSTSETKSISTLIIGASGFVGSYLLKKFEHLDEPVRLLARNPNKIQLQSSYSEVVKGDLENRDSLLAATKGIKTIYYLSHGMGDSTSDFEDLEHQQAKNLTSVIAPEVKIIYLSGIIPEEELSKHLRSRKQVGKIFEETQDVVIEFRASIIIGVGSTSFEMVRALVQRLPFILSADWSNSLCQPIGIDTVVDYLYEANNDKFNQTEYYDIGGSEVLKYKDLLVRYAKFMNLNRPELAIAKFPKRLAAEILKVVLPEYALVGEKLIESIEHETIVKDHRAFDQFQVKNYGLLEMFDKSRDCAVEDVDYRQFFSFLKSNKELPDYLRGQTLVYHFDIAESFNLAEVIMKLSSIPLINISKNKDNGFSLKLPMIGEIGVRLSADCKQVVIMMSAKYFFQKLGFSFFNKILDKLVK
jgi:uncharacterized protein YbjT (DUF2867 family)